MPPLGQPFREPPAHSREVILHCPLCGGVLTPRPVFRVGPDEAVGVEQYPLPLYRYECLGDPGTCDYSEAHPNRLVRGASS